MTTGRTPTINGSATSSLMVAAVGDPDGTRMITSIVALLVVLGIGLIMLAVWLFKLTRPDRELLAPLEVMGERKWRRADPVWQRRKLDQVRPSTAQPLQPSAAPPEFDEAFDLGPAASGFDDLHDAAVKPVDSDAPAAQPALPSTNGDLDPAPPRPPSTRPASPTPTGLARPAPDEFPDREIDPEIMAAAIAELDAELGRDDKRQPTD